MIPRAAALAFLIAFAVALLIGMAGCKPATAPAPRSSYLDPVVPEGPKAEQCTPERPCTVWKRTPEGGYKAEQRTS